METLVIFGADTRIGEQLVPAAVGAFLVYAVTKTKTEDDKILRQSGATPHVLDLSEASVDDIVKLLKEANPSIVVSCISADDVCNASQAKADEAAGLKALEAVEKAGVQRFLALSSMGVHDPGKMPGYYSNVSCLASKILWESDSPMRPYLEAKYELETRLHCSNLKFTVLRPGALFDNYDTGCKLGAFDLVRKGATVTPPSVQRVLSGMYPTSRQLVAQTLYACLRDEGTIGLTFDVVNGDGNISEELSTVTQAKIDAWKKDQETRSWDEAAAKKESEEAAQEQEDDHPGPKVVFAS